MSYKIQTLEWDVPEADVQYGIPIGYEVEFSQKPFFRPVLYSLNTYDEQTASIQGVFYYSLDDGVTWIDFPVGEQGKDFYSAYKMRLVVSSSVSSNIFAEKNGTLYRIASDGSEIIERYEVGIFDDSDIGIDSKTNSVYVVGDPDTLYKVDTYDGLIAGDNSVNLLGEPLGICVDGSRGSFWQVDRGKVFLKKMNGDEIFFIDNPFDIDVDYSSSSSSSESSSSSSS